MTFIQKIQLFIKFYLGNMPRDKKNYKFRWQQALNYYQWCIEMNNTHKHFWEGKC